MTIIVQEIVQADCLLCDLSFDDDGGRLSFDNNLELADALNRRDWFVNLWQKYALCSTCRHGNLMPKACQCIGSQWFYATHPLLECDFHESGGVRCEVLGNHERHQWSNHTIQHIRYGNGYYCEGNFDHGLERDPR